MYFSHAFRHLHEHSQIKFHAYDLHLCIFLHFYIFICIKQKGFINICILIQKIK